MVSLSLSPSSQATKLQHVGWRSFCVILLTDKPTLLVEVMFWTWTVSLTSIQTFDTVIHRSPLWRYFSCRSSWGVSTGSDIWAVFIVLRRSSEDLWYWMRSISNATFRGSCMCLWRLWARLRLVPKPLQCFPGFILRVIIVLTGELSP